jgi:hypothetical protein
MTDERRVEALEAVATGRQCAGLGRNCELAPLVVGEKVRLLG